MRAISLKPYDAWAVLEAGQREVGSYLRVNIQGPARFLLHCSGMCTVKDFGDGSARIFDLTGARIPELVDLPTDCIVGRATIVRCEQRRSKWHSMPFTVVLADVQPIPEYVSCFLNGRGFVFDVPDEVAEAIKQVVAPKAVAP